MRKLIAVYSSPRDYHTILNAGIIVAVTCFLVEVNGQKQVECTVSIKSKTVEALGTTIYLTDFEYDTEIERHLFHRYSLLLTGYAELGPDRQFNGDIIRADNV